MACQRSDYCQRFKIDKHTGALSGFEDPFHLLDGAYHYPFFVPNTDLIAYSGYSSQSIILSRINSTTDEQTTVSTTAVSGNPRSIAFSPELALAFVASSTGVNSVQVFTFDAAAGRLTAVSSVATASTNAHLAVHPSGRFVFSGSYDNGAVRAFSVDGASGTLVQVGADLTPASRSVEIALSRNGEYLVSTSLTGLHVFSINAGTGALQLQFSSAALGTVLGRAIFVGSGDEMVVTDPGTNQVHLVRLDFSARTVTSLSSISIAGLGARAAAAGVGNVAYVNSGATSEIIILDWSEANPQLVETGRVTSFSVVEALEAGRISVSAN